MRALEADARTLGPDHPDLACSLNNFASMYGEFGKTDEAEAMHRRLADTVSHLATAYLRAVMS